MNKWPRHEESDGSNCVVGNHGCLARSHPHLLLCMFLNRMSDIDIDVVVVDVDDVIDIDVVVDIAEPNAKQSQCFKLGPAGARGAAIPRRGRGGS